MKITVIGCGRWGSFIAWYLNKINNDVYLYGRKNSLNLKKIILERKNEFLNFPENMIIGSDLDAAISHGDIIIISISSQQTRNLMQQLNQYDLQGKTIILCMKGIEESTGMRLTQFVKEYLGSNISVAIWVGPGHVQDFIRGIPNCMVIDSENSKTKKFLVEKFSSTLIRFYIGNDLIGNEIGAAAKNVIGIASGMLDGIGYESLKGALMSRGTIEISRLIKAMGGQDISAYGLCHLGDYQATLFSKHSHNRMFGEMFVKHENYNELAEGIATTQALCKLGEQYNVDLPICKAVRKVIFDNANVHQILSDLFLRSIKSEF